MRSLFLASLRFCVHYCIDRDTVQKKKTAGFFDVMSTTNLKMIWKQILDTHFQFSIKTLLSNYKQTNVLDLTMWTLVMRARAHTHTHTHTHTRCACVRVCVCACVGGFAWAGRFVCGWVGACSLRRVCVCVRVCVCLILIAFITANSSLEPLIEGLCAQIHVNLR